ncbi:hypothetical protein GEMRC1_011345 [Eukaryota sp. GEM-RC1]
MVQGSFKPKGDKQRKAKAEPKLAKLKKSQKVISKGRVHMTSKRTNDQVKVRQTVTKEINRSIHETLMEKAQHHKESFKVLGKDKKPTTSSKPAKIDVSEESAT